MFSKAPEEGVAFLVLTKTRRLLYVRSDHVLDVNVQMQWF